MKLSIIESRPPQTDIDRDQYNADLLKSARTGKPFITPTVYRGQNKNINDPDRGTFYTPWLCVAVQHGKNIISKRLKFNNPLVVTGTLKALEYLVQQSIITPEIAKSFPEGVCGNPLGERIIAKGARRCGHDGIIYCGGLDEIIDLR